MSISSVVDDFLSKGIECSINRFEKKSKIFKKEKSNLLRNGCTAKTQLFTVRGKIIMVVTHKNTIISNIKFREYFKAKPRELSNNEIIKITGHPSGGLSPFGLKNPLKTYIDISLNGKNNIYLCAGMKNFVVTVNYDEIIELTCGQLVDICEYNDYVRGVII